MSDTFLLMKELYDLKLQLIEREYEYAKPVQEALTKNQSEVLKIRGQALAQMDSRIAEIQVPLKFLGGNVSVRVHFDFSETKEESND